LIDNATDAVLWADTVSEDLSAVDLFAIQDDIVRGRPKAPPGWYFGATSLNFFRQGSYEEGLREARRMDMPDYLYSHVTICGQMGRDAEGRQAVEQLLELAPDFGTQARERLAERQVLDGLRKAGLDISGPTFVN
jgi:hypothetical protein